MTRRKRVVPSRLSGATVPGGEHLFADPSLPSYDEEAAALLRRRVIDFLATVDAR
jgi:dienelactone hydrolase